MNIANITPSVRDLTQFLSPNPGKVGKIPVVRLHLPEDVRAIESHLQTWEDEEVAALVLRTEFPNTPETAERLRKELASTADILSCPFIRWDELRSKDEAAQSRYAGFDAQILNATGLDEKLLREIHALAETMHFRLIFSVKTQKEWDRISVFEPRVVFVEEGNDFTNTLAGNRPWLIGPESLQTQVNLKGVLCQTVASSST